MTPSFPPSLPSYFLYSFLSFLNEIKTSIRKEWKVHTGKCNHALLTPRSGTNSYVDYIPRQRPL